MTTIVVDLSAIVDGQQVDAADHTVPLNQLKTAGEQIVDGGYDFLKTMWIDPTTLTISADAITATQTRHRVETQGSASTDDLSTISGTVDMLMLQANSSGQAITFKHNVGNIWMEDARDYVLNTQNSVVVLLWNPTVSKWFGFARNLGSIWLSAGVVGTLSSDTLTATQSRMRVAAQTGTADDLATISNPNSYDILVLMADTGDTITVKHNTGNIWFANAKDYTLTGNTVLMLAWNDLASRWSSVGVSGASVEIGNPASSTYTDQSRFTLPYRATRSVANKGTFLEAQPRGGIRKAWYSHAVFGATYQNVGGTWATEGGAPADQTNATTSYARHTSTSTAGNKAGRRSPVIFRSEHNPAFDVAFKLTTNDDRPYFVGLMGATLPSHSGAGYTYTGVTGIIFEGQNTGFFTCRVYENGVLIGSNLSGSAGVLLADTFHVFRAWVDTANDTVYYQCDDGTIDSCAYVPTGTLESTNLQLVLCRMGDGVAGSIDISRMYAESD